MADANNDYNLTLFEACEYLNKSARTISRYIRRGILHPLEVRSRQGTLEYRFAKAELESIKKENEVARLDLTRQGDFQDEGSDYKTPISAQFASAAPIDPPTVPRAAFIPNVVYGEATANKDSEPINQNPAPDTLIQGRQDASDIQTKDKDIISLLKDTTDMLRGQLQVKDDQIRALGDKIDQLIERGRETNILLKGMQDKILRLGQPAPEKDVIVDESKNDGIVASGVAMDINPDIQDQDRQDRLSKPKKRIEKNEKEKTAKLKNSAPKKNFFGRLFG